MNMSESEINEFLASLNDDEKQVLNDGVDEIRQRIVDGRAAKATDALRQEYETARNAIAQNRSFDINARLRKLGELKAQFRIRGLAV